MSLLPNYNEAVLEIEKLEGYCLNPLHPRGCHRARVFAKALGIKTEDTAWLHATILAGLQLNEAVAQEMDVYGQRWRVDMLLSRQSRRTVVRTIWLLPTGQDKPRFVTCWVL
jgi:hypothetical protein